MVGMESRVCQCPRWKSRRLRSGRQHDGDICSSDACYDGSRVVACTTALEYPGNVLEDGRGVRCIVWIEAQSYA
jgi:hypothetical protein